MLRSTFSSLREYLTPISHESSFQKTGQLTPEEFVHAGDYLVHKFPTWTWGAASPGKRRDFLPENKQFLVTTHVPCKSRATTSDAGLELVDDGQDEWLVNQHKPEAKPEEDGPVDVEDLDALGIEEDEPVGETSAPGSTAERSYNVYITYSTSYRVPKAYLSGFDSGGAPLPPKEMFDDIVGDYKDKTVTIESAPFQSNLTLISIHPCRHAGVMRMLLDKADARALAESEAAQSEAAGAAGAAEGDGAEWEEIPQGLRVDQYLVIFLKFIASVTPTIEYDFTMSAL